MVQGCLEWQRTGLQPPAIVRAATSEYRAKNDMLADFLETCCQERGEIQAKVAYDAYAAYCSESGISPLTMNKFTDQMVVRFDRYAKNHKKFYIGISLLTD
jgi:putative DNA primase/helicase